MLSQAALIVEQVTPDSAADHAGLRSGYRLLACQDQPLLSPALLMAWEQNAPCPHQSLRLLVEADGEQRALEVEWGETGLNVRPDLSGTALARYAQGKEAFETHDYARAASCWSEAAEQAQTRLHAAWLHVRAAEAWEAIPDWQAAHDCYAQAGALWEDGQAAPKRNQGGEEICTEGDAEDTATLSLAWMAQGKCCHNLGDSSGATAWLARAQQLEERAGRLGWLAHTIHDQGTVAFYRGDLLSAHDLFSRALTLREQIAPDSMDTASSLNNLGLTAWKQGLFSQAQACFMRALRLIEQAIPDSLHSAILLNNLGLLAWQQGDLERAQDCHVRALAIRERHNPDSLETAMSLLNLGAVAEQREQLENAQDRYTRAYAIAERLAVETPGALSLLSECRINLGSVARKRGKLTEAQDHYDTALVLCERLAPQGIETASCLSNMGSLALERGEIARSQAYFARALACCEYAAPNSLTHADVLWDIGRAALKQECPQEAIMHCLQAVETVERLRTDLAAPDARALLMAQHTPKYASLIQAYLALNNPAAAFYAHERARARSLVEMLSERRLDFAATAPLELLARQQELEGEQSAAYDQLKDLASAAAPTADGTQIESLHRDLRRLERERQELIAEMRTASPRYASFRYPQPLSLREARTQIDAGTLLLSYLVAEEQTFLFAVTPQRLRVHVLPIGRAALEQRARAFRQTMKCPTLREPGAEQAIAQGRQLYDLLIRPVHALAARAKRLLLCPDGPLHTLPFGALVTNPNGRPRYLGAAKPLHSALSITAYAQMRQNPHTAPMELSEQTAASRLSNTPALHSTPVPWASRRVLAFGDPLYVACDARSGLPSSALMSAQGQNGTRNSPHPVSADEHTAAETDLPDENSPEWLQTRGLSLTPLPHTRVEVEFLALLFPQTAEIRVGAAATKTAALQDAPSADILHFACHGWFDPRMPLSSGLLLSQPDALGEQAAKGDNGLLQAWEIIQKLKLRADLVVLSACRTGLGQEVRGEGLIGLTRAFQYAGAQSLIVSLWDVNDAGTTLFMQTFYTSLKAGESKDEALRQGMRALQKHPHWKHPYFWSAFVLIGDRYSRTRAGNNTP